MIGMISMAVVNIIISMIKKRMTMIKFYNYNCNYLNNSPQNAVISKDYS